MTTSYRAASPCKSIGARGKYRGIAPISAIALWVDATRQEFSEDAKIVQIPSPHVFLWDKANNDHQSTRQLVVAQEKMALTSLTEIKPNFLSGPG